MAGQIVGDTPSILVSELYKRGEPVAIGPLRETEIDEGHLRVRVIPYSDLVISIAQITDRAKKTTTEHERTAHVAWADWQFNGRRFWVLCSACDHPCTRVFISTGALAGSLICRRCASIRYTSQDQDPVDRLSAQLSSILLRLRVVWESGPIPRPPPRPHRMHNKTYDRLCAEFTETAERLATMLEASGRGRTFDRLVRHLNLLLEERPPASD